MLLQQRYGSTVSPDLNARSITARTSLNISLKHARSINNPAADHGQKRFDASDLLHRHGHEVFGQNRKIGKLPRLQRTATFLIMRKPRAAGGVKLQSIGAAGGLLRAPKRNTTHSLAVEKPLQGSKRIVGSHAMRVGS